MKAEDDELFIQAMEEKIKRLIDNGIFEVVPHSREVYRHRSHIYAVVSKQQYGIDFHETYSPVVQWSTVRMLLLLLQLKG
eukprot:1458441-Ditylum_brightwellii.AAC.1